jgi:flagellar hook protein FlgE
MGFQQGLSGLSGAARNLDVIGNNIANSTTVGYKSAITQFADVYATSLTGTGGLQIGIGTQVAAVAQQFTQGSTSITNNPLDVAINGEGFFRLSGGGAVTYSRNGQFQLDKDGYIVNNTGLRLTGYGIDATGNIVAAAPADIRISFADISPNATTTADMVLNLDSRQDVPTVAPFNPANALSYNNSTSITTYDSLGNPHALTLYFVKLATPNDWEVYGVLDGALPSTVSLGGGAAGAPLALNFNNNGQLTTAMPLTVSAPLTNGAVTPLAFDLSFGGSTQYGSNFGVNAVSQDGYSSGRIAGVTIAADGVILGRYTNGQSKTLGQIALANFVNPRGLQAMGNNQWTETSESGQPTVGAPGSGTLGVVQSGAVEDSNVDLTSELVNLIIAQRMYQANAQTVRAQDQILQTLINLR